MKFEYTTPEIEIKLFSTEAIMGESDVSTDIEIDDTNTPPAFDYSYFEK